MCYVFLDKARNDRSFFLKPRLICQHLHLENLCGIQHFIANTEEEVLNLQHHFYCL